MAGWLSGIAFLLMALVNPLPSGTIRDLGWAAVGAIVSMVYLSELPYGRLSRFRKHKLNRVVKPTRADSD